jgi:hypothetical protein
MKVAQLARLLDSILVGFDGIVSATPATELNSFARAMQPFAGATVPEFVGFLEQFGVEFQKVGTISLQGKISGSKPRKEPKPNSAEQVAVAVAAIRSLYSEIDRGSVDEPRVNQVLAPINKMTVPQLHQVLAGLDIAEKPRTKAKVIEKIAQVIRHQLESRARSWSAGTS